MNALTIVLYVLVIMVALLLIGVVLIQQSKGGGFGSAFGGAGEAVFGAKAGSHLSKLTVILAAMFFALTMALVVITSHRDKQSAVSIVKAADNATVQAQTAPAVPAAPKAADSAE